MSWKITILRVSMNLESYLSCSIVKKYNHMLHKYLGHKDKEEIYLFKTLVRFFSRGQTRHCN